MGKDQDALFKVSFGSKEAAQSPLRVLLPQELLADLDLSTLELQKTDLTSDALASVRQHLPEFEFVLDDLSQLTDEELRARGAPALASITLLLFKHGRQGEERCRPRCRRGCGCARRGRR